MWDSTTLNVNLFRAGPILLLDHRAIPLPYLSPTTIQVVSSGRKWSLGSSLLIDLNTPSRFFTHPDVSIFQLGATVEDFPRAFVKRRIFLNAEVIAHDIQRGIGHMPHRRNITRTVPGSFHAVLFGKNGNLTSRGESACLRDMHPDVI